MIRVCACSVSPCCCTLLSAFEQRSFCRGRRVLSYVFSVFKWAEVDRGRGRAGGAARGQFEHATCGCDKSAAICACEPAVGLQRPRRRLLCVCVHVDGAALGGSLQGVPPAAVPRRVADDDAEDAVGARTAQRECACCARPPSASAHVRFLGFGHAQSVLEVALSLLPTVAAFSGQAVAACWTQLPWDLRCVACAGFWSRSRVLLSRCSRSMHTFPRDCGWFCVRAAFSCAGCRETWLSLPAAASSSAADCWALPSHVCARVARAGGFALFDVGCGQSVRGRGRAVYM